jgi:2-polyprenyl-6-methoxyphenol hydroxylase-like FAD-dependent oxidoreductase
MNTLSCDVLVAGGGPAGLAAGVAAARCGARVILLERHAVLGGLATAGLVGTVCGLYLRDTAATVPRLVAGGFLREFSERLARASSTRPLPLREGLWVLPYAPRAFERLADDLVRETGELELALHATLTDVQAEGGRIVAARALAWGDALTIRPGCLVDCTGEATAAALAGAPTFDGITEQSPALVFVIENVAGDFAPQGFVHLLRCLRRGVADGYLPAGCDSLALVPGPCRDGRVAFKLALTPPAADAPPWRQVTAWERNGRALIDEIRRFLPGQVAAFRNASLAHTAIQIGVRAGRRSRGPATLTDDDVASCRKHEDAVARGCWPPERWGAAPRPELTYFLERAAYDIPLGCLRVGGLENAFVAGRCLSAEPGALASARVIGTSLATGWAAGSAAAFTATGREPAAAVALIRAQMDQ